MPEHLSVADGIVAKDSIAESEAAQYEALKRGVLAGQQRKAQEERERRVSLGLPAELTAEEKKAAKREEKENRRMEKERRKDELGRHEEKASRSGRRVLGCLCFGA